MNEVLRVIVTALLCSLLCCRLPTNGDGKSLAAGFRFEPEAFDSFQSVSRAHYSLSRASRTSLWIMQRGEDGTWGLVQTLFEGLYESPGTHVHTWLGDTQEGLFASSGVYLGVLEVESERFEAIVRVYHR